MNNTYLAGSLVRVATYSGGVSSPAGGFRDSTGALVDPQVVTLRYRPGVSAVVVTAVYPAAPIVRDGTGLYRADLDTTGFPTDTWTYIWVGSLTAQAAAEGTFNVMAVPF